MKLVQVLSLAVMATFYLAYFTKMIVQRRHGITTDQIAKGKKPKGMLTVEILMKIATYSIVAVEIFSIIADARMWRSSYALIGVLVAAVGVIIFIVAMLTMRESWRAGIPENDRTELVTNGIYRISRNPAFLGFDLMYIGILIAAFNYVHLAFVIFAIVMLHLQVLEEEKFLIATFGEPYVRYKASVGRYFIFDKDCSKKKKIISAVALVLVLVIGLGGFSIYGSTQMAKLPNLTFKQSLEYTTKNNPDAVITVGIIKDGESSYKVYGNNGKELAAVPHTYEIGSLTKTFTASLISKAISEGKIDINATIDEYLPLEKENSYPTIEALLTHTSGYDGYYFDSAMLLNAPIGRNDFYGITKESVLHRANNLSVYSEDRSFNYSNYGYALLGLVLESVYGTDYTSLVNGFVRDELGMKNTMISTMDGDLDNYWAWKENDAYLSAGALTSDISDMLLYAQMQLDNNSYLAASHEALKTINASTASYEAMGIRMDEIGMAWIKDAENGIIWHNGGTGNYNAYLGFSIESGTAVVILSNLSPSYRIPATVLGVKLLKELK